MGFSDETFQFLADLEANNSKEWFDENRKRYEAQWKDAALSFIREIEEKMRALDPSLRAEARLNGSLRRINRDVRFSKDKSPYKPRLHMIFWTEGHPNRSPGMHLVLHPRSIGYGAGQFGLEPKALAAMRDRIVDPTDGDALMDALEKAAKVGCTMGEPDLARLPKGFEVEGRRAELLRHKVLVARTRDHEEPVDAMKGATAVDWLMGVTDELMPLIRWLSAAS